MRRRYSENFKRRMVQRLASPNGPSARALSEEVGVCASNLSRWLREAMVGAPAMSGEEEIVSRARSRGRRRPQDWSSQDKLAAVLEASSLGESELGAFLRREGLHEAQLEQWRRDALSGLSNKAGKSKEHEEAKKRIKELERELGRKEAALAETAALLVLQKKVQSLWGDEERSILPRSAR